MRNVRDFLCKLGLNLFEAQVYFYLVKNGPQKLYDLGYGSGISTYTLKLMLEDLEKRGIVYSYPWRSREYEFSSMGRFMYAVVPFEKLLDLCIEAKIKQEMPIKETREKLLSDWLTMMEKNSARS